jgi:hypothetical protein
VVWQDLGTGFTEIGFAASPPVRYIYQVTVTEAGFLAEALADTDGDGRRILWIVTESTSPHIIGTDAGDAELPLSLGTMADTRDYGIFGYRMERFKEWLILIAILVSFGFLGYGELRGKFTLFPYLLIIEALALFPLILGLILFSSIDTWAMIAALIFVFLLSLIWLLTFTMYNTNNQNDVCCRNDYISTHLRPTYYQNSY